MTIATTSNKVIGQGNAATTNWPFTFLIPDAASLVVLYTDATGLITTIPAGQYSVAGLNDPNGGSVTYPISGAPIAVGSTLTVLRTVAYTQTRSIRNQSGFFPDVYEAALDYLTMQTQQINETLDRSLTLPVTVDGVSVELPVPSAGAVIGWNSTGTALVNLVNAGNIAASGYWLAQVLKVANTDSVLIGLGNVGAGGSITSGVRNVLIGENAGRLITDGVDNVFLGYRAGLNTQAPGINRNVVIGSGAGISLQTGNGVSTGGFQEVLIGEGTGAALTLGPNSTMVGHQCGKATTTGGSNTFFGRAVFNSNTTGGFNCGVGHAAGFRYTTGAGNVFVGDTAGNPAIAGDPDRTGNSNVAVGQQSGPTLAAASNTACFGDLTTVQASSTGKFGNALTDTNVSGRLHHTEPLTAEATAAGVTYTVAQFLGGVINRSGPAGVFSDTTPTAALIVAAIPGCEVGSGCEIYIRNTTANLLTMLAGAGVTLTGTTTVAATQTRLYKVRVTNIGAGTEAVTVQGVFTAAN